MVEPRDIIARGVYPWTGDSDYSSQGLTKLQWEMAYRAADNALKLLKESGYEFSKED